MRSALGALPVLLCLPLLVNTGCTRTSDGSIAMTEPSPPSILRNPWWRRSSPGPTPPPQVFPPQPEATPLPAAAQPATARPRPANRTAPRSSTPVRPTSKAGKAVQQFHGMRVGVRPPFTPSESGKPLNCANKTQPGGRVKVVCE